MIVAFKCLYEIAMNILVEGIQSFEVIFSICYDVADVCEQF